MIRTQDIVEAQDEWAAAVIAVGRLRGNRDACIAAAGEALDRLYAFDFTDVLFKPTKAAAIPFRSSRESAMSYFVGGNADFPEDGGFALEPWNSVDFDNALIRIEDDRAFAMGHYVFTSPDDLILKVEFTIGYRLDDKDSLRIWLHHSSLPYTAVLNSP